MRSRVLTVAGGALLAAAAMALLVTPAAAAPAASAVTAATPGWSTWQAKVGSAGVNGTANLSAMTSGSGSIGLKLLKLRASLTLPVTLYKGACTPVGAVLLPLPPLKTTSAGAASRTTALTAAQVTKILAATAGSGKIAIRVGSGSSAKCGALAKRTAPGPQAVVQRFYDWYVTDTNWNHLLVRPDITPGFVRFLKSFDGAANPIVCAQDYPDTFTAGAATISGSSATVKVTSVLGNPTVKLAFGPVGWQISAVDCGFR